MNEVLTIRSSTPSINHTEGHVSELRKYTRQKSPTKRTNSKTMANKQKPEDAFYDNLTLGLMGILENVPRVCNVECEKRQPCEKAQVVNWEQRHCVYLPEDMKKFYLSTDGYILYWSYQYAPNDIRRVGYIHFPHLLQVTLLRENVDTTHGANNNTMNNNSNIGNPNVEATVNNGLVSTTNTANVIGSVHTSNNASNKDLWGNPKPVMTAKTKIFEINTINDQAKVHLRITALQLFCHNYNYYQMGPFDQELFTTTITQKLTHAFSVCMVYETTGTNNPKFYLLELNTMKWQFLSDTFSEYLRMAIAHLGLPYWELCFSSFGLPSWAEQLFLLLAPHLLEEREQRRGRIINPALETPYNIINPNVFRGKPKNVTKPATTTKHK